MIHRNHGTAPKDTKSTKEHRSDLEHPLSEAMVGRTEGSHREALERSELRRDPAIRRGRPRQRNPEDERREIANADLPDNPYNQRSLRGHKEIL